MKNILIIIDSLVCGGAEKSLISLLNSIDYKKYSVDLLLFKRGGDFEVYLPNEVNIIDQPVYFKYLNKYNKIDIFKKVKFFLVRVKTSIKLRLNKFKRTPIHSEQIVYKSVRNILEPIEKKYDFGIAYNQGFPTYFLAEKVYADKKLAWINCNYEKTLYDKELDSKFYSSIDKIIVVSDFIYKSMKNMKYNYKDKLKVIKDIVDPNLIEKMSMEDKAIELENINDFKILTVGRLAKVKGYDLLVRTAKLLKENNLNFKWFIIGEGSERGRIINLINKYELNNNIVLLGTKMNPYPYMRSCDLYVQTSLKEGFGLTVIEAKILKNVIVSTNFDTINELLTDKYDGVVVDKNEKSIYEGINSLVEDKSYYEKIKRNVEIISKYSSIDEIDKIYEELM